LKNWISTFVAGGLLVLAAGIASECQAEVTKKGLQFGGSIRGRYEYLGYMTDATGSKKDTRGRIRYRLRFDAKATINPHSKFYGRLVSGTDSRSGNSTLGDPEDFGPTEITIRYAALVITPWADGKLPSGKGKWAFDFGRVKNPYHWKGHGKDLMLWDNDIALAGVGTQFSHKLGTSGQFFVQTGYYQLDENSSESNDPYMVPVQGGIIFGGDRTTAGIRGSYFYMDELNKEFIQRGVDGTFVNDDGVLVDGATSSGGNVPDGLTGDENGGKLQVVETQAFVGTGLGSVPLVLSGGYSNNNSATASVMYEGVAKNSAAYNIQIEAGAKKKALLGGIGWYHIEANAFPSQFIDSDLLDGHTNREGVLIYLAKTVMKNTALGLQFFRSDAIDKHESLGESVKNSKRNRLQIDLLYKF
jgi:hypothetical protein